MARRSVRVCLVSVALSLACAAQASAAEWDVFRWLERLSGPGPFQKTLKIAFTQPFACYGVKVASIRYSTEDTTGRTQELYPDISCSRASRDRLWIKFAGHVSKVSGPNTLDYGVPLTDDDKVTMWTYLVVSDIAVQRYLDVGASLGAVHFSGSADRFSGFAKFAFEPIRVTFKPLSLSKTMKWPYREILQFRYTALSIPSGLDDGDFGARPETYSSGKEFQSSYSIVLNGDFLFDLLLKRK